MIRLSTGEFRRLDRTDFLGPCDGRSNFADGTKFIGGIAGDADVVITFQDKSDISDVEHAVAPTFGHSTGAREEGIDKVIGVRQEGL